MAEVIELYGRTFTRLFVFDRAKNNKRGSARWRCLCECGRKHIALGVYLRRGVTKSCGCLRKEILKAQQDKSLTHGHNRRGKTTLLYYTWKNWRHRKKTRLDFPAFLRQQEGKTCSQKKSTGKNSRQA